jgi:hypothetical protein
MSKFIHLLVIATLAVLALNTHVKAQWITNGSAIYNSNTGNVGIGTTSPTTKLEIVGPTPGNGANIRANGDILVNAGGSLFFDGNYSYGSGSFIRPVSTNTQAFFTSGTERMRITPSGSIGIGTASTGTFKLAVEGKIGAREVNVTTTSPWPDYVFECSYRLPSLFDVKNYISRFKHLPEVPSATEVETSGINLGEMNAVLLKKVEELTLYMIEMKEENEKLKNEVESIKRTLNDK